MRSYCATWRKNKAELEATPNGAYAVTDGNDRALRPGVIFFLRQRNASPDKQEKTASPIHPYYAVYIHATGDIRYGCANARQVMEAFEASAVGKTEPLQKLCDRFDRETRNGTNMARYDKLLNTVIAHIRKTHQATQVHSLAAGAPRDAKLVPASKSPKQADSFELVSWLVIAEDKS